MVLKRPFGDEESYELPWKHPRQSEYSNQLPSFVENVFGNDATEKSPLPVIESEGCFNRCQYDRLVSENGATNKEFEINVPSSKSSVSWVNSRTSEEDFKSEAAIRFSYFPGIFESDYSTRPRVEDNDIYSSVFDYLPRKLVSVGPDHQADVPIWEEHGTKSDLGSLDMAVSNQNLDDVDSEKMMGTCVNPMPDSEASVCGTDRVGKGRTDCSCQDEGSLRCVRQHIMETREKLIGTLGLKTFAELGFCDMGEEVATKWSEEDEQIFNEVVFSNPASLGKNFWDHLSVVFPSRTKKEIVSYYFNVFVLRRRGEQNRLDPLNIDSDNDEWQSSEDGDDELRTTEEDSVVDSPEDIGFPLHRKHFDRDVESGDDESCDNNVGNDGAAVRCEGNGKLDHISEACNRKLPGECSSGRAYEDDHDLQDDSCTSYECGQLGRSVSSNSSVAATKQECGVETEHGKHFQDSCSYSGLSGLSNLGYDMESCDAKVWDVGFVSSCKTDLDLLPTFHMIQEVFGDEASWNNKGRDGKSTN